MEKIVRFILDNTQITVLSLVLIIIIGVYSYIKMPKVEDPSFTFRIAEVRTFFPGASAERVENLVTDPIEKAIQQIPNISNIQSSSSTGLSIIKVEAREGSKNLRPIWDELRRKIDGVTNLLPESALKPIVNDEFGDVYGTIITIFGEDFELKDLKLYADKFKDELIKLPEVAKVKIFGNQEERVYIEYNEARLAEAGVSTFQLQEFMTNRNIVNPGGSFVTDSERLYLEPTGKYLSLEDIANTPFIISKSGQILYLKDLAEVKRGYIEPPIDLVFSSGKQAIAIGISLREGSNIFELGNGIKRLIEQTKNYTPLGIEFDIITYQPDAVNKKVNHFLRDLFSSIAIIIVFIVIALGIRSSLILSTMIPMSILLSFIFMYFFGVTINHISLSALIISLGMLVDNGIVITESIITQIQEGVVRKQAAIESCKEYAGSLLNSALTTSVAFLPIYLAKSDAGEYTSALFIVVTISLLSSWFLAMTMIPFLCIHLLKVEKNEEKINLEWIYERYRKLLISFLKRPILFVSFIVALFLLSFIPQHHLKKIFFPPSDKLLIESTILLPRGYKIEKTTEISRLLDSFIRDNLMINNKGKNRGVTNWSSFVGGNSPRYVINYISWNVGPEVIDLLINVTDKEELNQVKETLEEFVREHIPNALASFKLPQQGPSVEAPIVLRISGDDLEELLKINSDIKNYLLNNKLYRNIRDNIGFKTKKIVINIDQIKIQRAGLTNLDVATSLQTSLSGFVFTKYNEIDKTIPVVVRATLDQVADIDKIKTINVRSQATNKVVPLNQIADIEIIWQQELISRRGLKKNINILANVASESVTPIQATEALIPWLKEQKKHWPPGYTFEIAGEYGDAVKSENSLNASILIAVSLMILFLCVEFNSIKIPMIIMLTIPMGVIGVFFGLFITNTEMGFMTYLGILSLSGIVLNHSIVLIDRIVHERNTGKSAQDSIVDGSVRRLRPIVLTALIMVVGLIPLLFDRASMFYSMGISLIFGMIFATVLTLGFIPVLYSLFFGIKFDETYSE